MPYEPVDDVPGVETNAVDAKELDPMMSSVIEAVRFALRHTHNFKTEPPNGLELISILRSQLLLYETTHKSLRLVLARAYDKKDYSIVPDATSLVREQIEKIYIIALFVDNPRKWILHYSRAAWRTDYENYRLELEEYGAIDRHQEFLKKHYPEFLSNMQRIKIGNRTETIVSDFAKRGLQHQWDNPGDQKPSWFVKAQKGKRKKINRLRDYIRNYYEFPTPGRAAATITDEPLRRFLFRWHRDYSTVCQYSHVAFGKILIPYMSDEHKDWKHAEKTEYNGRKLAERTVYWSLISAATSCALIVRSLKHTYGSRDELKDFWKVLYGSSLAAKGYWEMYIKSILK
jgi:hypothetical protein